MKAYGGVKVQLLTLLTLALDEGEWSASHPQTTPGKEPLVTTEEGAGWAPEMV
jgi:hypothetical protein